ncbi:MFS transporter [Streptomyces sp. NPDC057806]|uniref:MFS transporter n=1 Tax=Streptomyces sp. NPDC057806 TaxID=3346255 RepID=UPI0036C42EF5
MTSTSASPSLDAAPAPHGQKWTPRLVGVLIALIWPTQLLVTVGILGSNATADVAQSFHTTQVAWFSLIVTLVSALLSPFVIKLGDLYGKKRIMLGMIALGVVGDVIAATAGSFEMVLVGRGLAACYGPFPALAFPAVRDIFPGRLVKSASGILGSSLGLVALGSPFLAGWLIDDWGYKGAMWFLVGATTVSFVLVATLVPETPKHAFDSGFDWLGGIVLGSGLAVLVYAVGQGQSWGWGSVKTLAWLAAGAAALAGFLLVERASSHPILDLGVLRRRAVATTVVSGALAQAAAYTAPVVAILLALYPHIPGVSAGFGWTAQHSATVGVTWNLLLFVTGLVASRFLRGVDTRLIWWAGVATMGLGYLLAGLHHDGAVQLTWTMCVASLGSGLVVAAAPVLVVGAVSPDEQGLGSGMLTMLTHVFGAMFGAAMFAALAADSTVLEGTAFYGDSGYTWAFWVGALFSAVALAVGLLMPPLREQEEEAEKAPSAV